MISVRNGVKFCSHPQCMSAFFGFFGFFGFVCVLYVCYVSSFKCVCIIFCEFTENKKIKTRQKTSIHIRWWFADCAGNPTIGGTGYADTLYVRHAEVLGWFKPSKYICQSNFKRQLWICKNLKITQNINKTNTNQNLVVLAVVVNLGDAMVISLEQNVAMGLVALIVELTKLFYYFFYTYLYSCMYVFQIKKKIK